ncbi:TlpA family protein disulfide reductase [Pedobacter sp. PWIIR3]
MKRISLMICLLLVTAISIANTKITSYTGILKGYTTAWGFKTGKVIVQDAVTGLSESYIINISPDGKFTAEFPLSIDKECWISFPFFNATVYFLAGKKLTQNFDLTAAPKVSSVFEGDGSRVNNDINKVRPILMAYNWDVISSDIYQYTPDQYKAYFLNIQARKIATIDSVAKTSKLSKTAYDLATNDIIYTFAEILSNYNHHIQTAYRIRNKISFENRSAVLPEVKLEPAYYDYLQKISFNRPAALASYKYTIFLKRLKNLDIIFDKANRINYAEEINTLKQQPDTTDHATQLTLKYYRAALLRNEVLTVDLDKARPEVLKSLINKDISLELKLMSLQDTCQNIGYNKIPLTDAALARLKSNLKADYLFAPILELNNSVKHDIESLKIQTSHVDNEKSKVAADSVFNNIISKYKGKVIFVDFWATWCGPCLAGIEEMKDLKTELQDQDIVFLYITDQSSPETTYNIMISKIKGEHYKLKADEYNLISEKLKINGIPHYTIFNKNSEIVKNGAHVVDTNQLKAELLQMAKE